MADKDVYTGVWQNWNLGPPLGLTLTVPAIWGLVLIAVLALVVKWAGTHFWGIICFVLHDIRAASASSHDGLHYQHQALLRSKVSETDFLIRMCRLSWAWRASTPRVFRRGFPLAILAALNLIAFLVAGILSARVTVGSSEGLLVGHCGNLELTANKDFPLWTPSDWETGDALFVAAYNAYRGHLTYAQTCYAGNIQNSSDAQCKTPSIPYIESEINREADCPFAAGVCTHPAITLDTGLMDSSRHLGINMGPKSRLQVRKKTSCAPIDMEAYSTEWTSEIQPGTEMFFPTLFPNDTFKYYSMGSSWLFGAPISNFTFVMSNYSLYVNGLPYTFGVRTAYAKNFTESGFFPDQDLNRTDADVSLLTLNNRVAYTGRVDDPFFEAHLNSGGNRLADAWVSDKTLTGIACTEQYQFCNPASTDSGGSPLCGPLGALYDYDLTTPPAALALNARQTATYRLLRDMVYSLRFNSFIMFLKNEILAANKLVYGSFGISSPLVPTAWHIEIENIHNITLAGLQLNTISHAAATDVQIRPGLQLIDHIVPETDADSLALCRNQRVKVTTHSSFSMAGILIIVCVSGLIILIDVILPGLVHRFQRTSPVGDAAKQAWDEDDILQIQRLAFEGRGIGPWKGKSGGNVPVTAGWDVRFRRDKVYAAGGKTEVMVPWETEGESTTSYEVLEPLNGAYKNDGGAGGGFGGGRVSAMEMKTPQSSVFRWHG
ncbi:hypothetical protein A1O7_07847 [Cladophialophora yegresii CBS 114405]|uniref:Uncharacterized protein n=1 Tax=Cladophialophora yegresii CBS 114405 TaxID=1182544 RepID=W9WG49_9EURO|nr:uncharacterized protein A1O7_07847 [Cladophialophora yegresii CBS 114405]EXJ57499.1 hypothetical protein A1O7_07847 [Cladophialophora yegresii CBS 114405]